MISADQPTCFPSNVTVVVSSKRDGTMLNRETDTHAVGVLSNRHRFCDKNNIDYDNVVYQRIEYHDGATYDTVVSADEWLTTKHRPDVVADAIITQSVNTGIFLPLADCIGLVLFCPKRRLLAVLHMGRHSTLSNLIDKTIQQMEKIGASRRDIIAWMTPGVSKESYRMDYFDEQDNPEWQDYHEVRTDGIYLDLAGFNQQRLVRAGLVSGNIYISPVNTVTSADYFSHNAGDKSGRFAVLAMMR